MLYANLERRVNKERGKQCMEKEKDSAHQNSGDSGRITASYKM